MGDLNFRCMMEVDTALDHLSRGHVAPLLAVDELLDAMGSGEVLHGFREAGPVTFLPSFRRVFGSRGKLNEEELAAERAGTLVGPEPHDGGVLSVGRLRELYATAAKDGTSRVPSYTDRILIHSLPDVTGEVQCRQYASSEALAQSRTIDPCRPICC